MCFVHCGILRPVPVVLVGYPVKPAVFFACFYGFTFFVVFLAVFVRIFVFPMAVLREEGEECV